MIKKLIIASALLFFPLVASANIIGISSQGGSLSVNQLTATSEQFNVIPSAGYKVKDVLVDGVSVGPVITYTFDNITSDHVINASFTLITSPTTDQIQAQIKDLVGQLVASLNSDIASLQSQINDIQARITIYNNINSIL